MAFDLSACRQCGEALPSGANYCPGCGLARQSQLLDPLGLGATAPIAAAPVGARVEHLRVWVGLGAVVVAVALVWAALTAGGSPPDGSEDASGSEEGPLEGGSTTSPPTTTASTTTTLSPALESTEPVGPMVGYANDIPGPVLGPGVEGVIVAVGDRALSRLDLATGAVESSDLEWPVDYSETLSVVIDGKLVATSTGTYLVLTDLRTGEQGERIELDKDALGFADARVIGRAGPDSVWLAGYPTPYVQSTAAEVDLHGTVLRQLQLDPLFYAGGAIGRIVYVSGAGAAWRYDTESDTSEPFGLLGATSGDQIVVVSCRPTTDCEAAVETESGLEPIPGLSSTDLVNGSLALSPDRQHAVIAEYGSEGLPTVIHVDLVTGQRTDLGRTSIEPYVQVIWLGDDRWILGQVADSRRRLFAVDVETAEQVEIDLPDGSDGFGLDPWAARLLLLPPA